MTSAETLVLATAVLLVVAVFLERNRGTFTPRTGVFLLTVAMLAVVAVLLHMVVP